MLCPREVNHFRRSCTDYEKCTAILLGSSMLICLDEWVHIEALGVVRNIMTEGRMAGAVDFINIEMKLGKTGEDLQGLDSIDSIDWYAFCGPECRGGGQDVVTHEKVRWLQQLKEFKCTVTSTWTNNDGTILGGLGLSGFVRNNSIRSWPS